MKPFNTKVVMLSVFCLSLFAVTNLFAQEWSAQQKEVWKNVEAYWALDTAGDTEGFMAYFDPDYVVWSITNTMPNSKETAKKFIANVHKTTKVLVYDIQPVAIKIHGDIAFVHYYWNEVIKDAEGKQKGISGRWTDILMKRADKWVLIGDHGGQTSGD